MSSENSGRSEEEPLTELTARFSEITLRYRDTLLSSSVLWPDQAEVLDAAAELLVPKTLSTRGVLCVEGRRRCGKTMCVAVIAINYAISKPNSSILIITTMKRDSNVLTEKMRKIIIDSGYETWFVNAGDDYIYLRDPRDEQSGIRKINFVTQNFCRGSDKPDLMIIDEVDFISRRLYIDDNRLHPLLAFKDVNLIFTKAPGFEAAFVESTIADNSSIRTVTMGESAGTIKPAKREE